ncbi:MAG: glycosyltransferase family 1 protein [Armatimonadetes bacterium]|nr:glycosyltransferase family 1 protein [Armatimonadota bacterium]
MRVVLDARPLSHPQSGGYRSYVMALVQGLAELASTDVEILLYLDRPVDFSLPFETRILSSSRLKTDFALFAQQVKRDQPDLVHGTVNYLPVGISSKTVLLLYDALLLKRYPWEGVVQRSLRQRLLNAYWAGLMRHSARTATSVFTISQGSAQELASVLGGSPQRFLVVPLGISLPLPRAGVVREPTTILAIAAPDARKNIEALYEALPLLDDLNPTLKLVCTTVRTAAAAETEVARRGLKNVQLLRNLDNQALSDAYATARVFVFPSRLEGFGLPPLEAMQAGTPVAASNALPMPEILGAAPLYFDPEKPAELAATVRCLLTNADEWSERSHAGIAQAKRYSLKAMAEGTLSLWRELAA